MRLGFITNKPYSACETFIKAQVDHLPFSIIQYYGQALPLIKEGSIENEINLLDKVIKRIVGENKYIQYKTGKLFKQDSIEVILAQYGPTGAMITEVCKKIDLPMVVHFHGYDAVRKSTLSQFEDSYKKMFLYATRIISVSHAMTQQLVKIGCPIEKITYNPCGPNSLFLDVVPQFSKMQIIGIGRFVEKKAPDLLILSFSKVLRQMPEVKLILAGDGELLPYCKQLVRDLKIESSISFPGVISPDEFRKYLAESLIFVQHSVTAQDGDMEGTPVAILEASGAGLPVVSTKHAGIPDVIDDKVTGLLVDERDIDGMAEKIIFLLRNPEISQKMGNRGKSNIRENFSFRHHIDGLASILSNALHK